MSIRFSGILNCNTFSVALSIINENTKNELFHLLDLAWMFVSPSIFHSQNPFYQSYLFNIEIHFCVIGTMTSCRSDSAPWPSYDDLKHQLEKPEIWPLNEEKGAMAVSITTLNIATFSITTLRIHWFFATLFINVVIKPEFSKFPKKIKGMVAEFISM